MHRCLAVALSVCSVAACADPPRLEISSAVVVEDAPREFGGLSALIVADDGTTAQVLTDRGILFDVGLERDESAVLQEIVILSARYLYPFKPEVSIDSEGLASAPQGGIFVSTETPSQVLHYAPEKSWPTPTQQVPTVPFPKENRGPEALAIDPQGRLLTIPEAPLEGERDFPILRLEDGHWVEVGRLERLGTFMVVGADYGPDDRLYVLERAVSPLGFRSRIRRVSISGGATRSETVFQSRLAEFDNLEGISLWRDAAGRIRITMVSDDNFLAVQRTEFVELLLAE